MEIKFVGVYLDQINIFSDKDNKCMYAVSSNNPLVTKIFDDSHLPHVSSKVRSYIEDKWSNDSKEINTSELLNKKMNYDLTRRFDAIMSGMPTIPGNKRLLVKYDQLSLWHNERANQGKNNMLLDKLLHCMKVINHEMPTQWSNNVSSNDIAVVMQGLMKWDKKREIDGKENRQLETVVKLLSPFWNYINCHQAKEKLKNASGTLELNENPMTP